VALHRRELLALAAAPFSGQAAAAPSRPNILLVLMDDMAQRALSCYGNPYVPTPNIDRLASEGMKFTQAYVTPQCTPTRATIMTGQYTARNKMWHVIPRYGYPYARVSEPPFRENLSRDAFTLAKGLKQAGYATGCFGKWHLTANEDGDYGSLRSHASGHYGFDATLSQERVNLGASGDKEVNRITSEAIRFIEANKDRPFFCYVPHHSIHGVVAAPRELTAKYRAKGYPEAGPQNATYLAALEHMDAGIGRLLTRLDELDLARKTAVFFLTDNGGVAQIWNTVRPPDGPVRIERGDPWFENPPLRAGKGSSYEGGIRVPLLVRWPGEIRGGTLCQTPVHAVDMLPTLFEIAGAKAPAGHVLDGVSIVPLLKSRRIANRALYWYQPFYDIRWAHTPSAAVLEGGYKLIEFFGDYLDASRGGEYVVGNRIELYDLSKDAGESRNLAESDPGRARRMRDRLHAWIRSCGETPPGLNPAFDPRRALEERRGA
jgi:uncharacterized sulfatase